MRSSIRPNTIPVYRFVRLIWTKLPSMATDINYRLVIYPFDLHISTQMSVARWRSNLPLDENKTIKASCLMQWLNSSNKHCFDQAIILAVIITRLRFRLSKFKSFHRRSSTHWITFGWQARFHKYCIRVIESQKEIEKPNCITVKPLPPTVSWCNQRKFGCHSRGACSNRQTLIHFILISMLFCFVFPSSEYDLRKQYDYCLSFNQLHRLSIIL